MTTPHRSYLDAHLERTRQFMIGRGLYKPEPVRDIPYELQQFLEEMK